MKCVFLSANGVMSQFVPVSVGRCRIACVLMWGNMACCGLVKSARVSLNGGYPTRRVTAMDLQGSFPGSESTTLNCWESLWIPRDGTNSIPFFSSLTRLSLSLPPSFHVPFPFLALSKSLGVFTSLTWWWQVGGVVSSSLKLVGGDSHFQAAFYVVSWIVLLPHQPAVQSIKSFKCFTSCE